MITGSEALIAIGGFLVIAGILWIVLKLALKQNVSYWSIVLGMFVLVIIRILIGILLNPIAWLF